MLQTVAFYRVVVEPRTFAGSPPSTANHAKLGPATTVEAFKLENGRVPANGSVYKPSHMITALPELNHSLASITSLPTFIFRLCDEFCRLLIVGAIPTTVEFCIALDTNLGVTLPTFPILLAIIVLADILGPNVFVAVLPIGAVNAAAVGEFAIFLVPGLFKVVTKEALYIFKGNVVFSAAFGRHVLGIGDRQLEASLEAWVAHAMAALELDRLARFQVVHADKTLNSTNLGLAKNSVPKTEE